MNTTNEELYVLSLLKENKTKNILTKELIMSCMEQIENSLNKSKLNNAKISYLRFNIKEIRKMLKESLPGSEELCDVSMFVSFYYDEIMKTLYKVNEILDEENKISNQSFICISLLKDEGEAYLEFPISISPIEFLLFIMFIITVLSSIAAIAYYFLK